MTKPAQRGRPARGEIDARDQRVRQAAAKEFSEHGLQGASVEAIARAARVSKQTIYQRFGGKEGLFHDMVVSVATTPQKIEIPEVLSSVADFLVEVVMKTQFGSPHNYRMMQIIISEANALPDVIFPVIKAGGDALMLRLEEIFAFLSASGRLPQLDARRAAEAFSEQVTGAAVMGRLTSRDFDAEAAVRRKVDFFLAGLEGGGASIRPAPQNAYDAK